MKTFNKRFISGLLMIIMTFVFSSIVLIGNNTAYAAESKALKDAQAKITHLTKSLKINYLGIKNQGTWELYIKQARDLINKIPKNEETQKYRLTEEVDKDEGLVKALGRINQVEKSIQPKSEGGYGNYLGIKNAETWDIYLELAKINLDIVDTSVFKKQYDELVGRKNKVSKVVEKIKSDFQNEYDKAVKLFEDAKADNSIEKAKTALIEAEKLGTCSRSDNLENEIKNFIDKDLNLVIYDTYMNYRYGFSMEYPNTFNKGFEGDNRAGISLYSDDLNISVYGQNNVFDYDGYSYYKNYLDYIKGNIIDKQVTKNSVEIISQENNATIYTKTVVGKGSINTLEISINKDKVKEYEDIITHVVDSFKTPFVDYPSDTAYIE